MLLTLLQCSIVIVMQIKLNVAVVALRQVHFLTFLARILFVSDFVPLLRSTKRILFTSFFSPAGIDRGRQVTSDFRPHLGLTDTLGRNLMLVSIRCQLRWIWTISKDALLWISKVRGYDHVCSTRSVKKNTKIPLIKQQDTSNALFESLIITRLVCLLL